MAMGGHGSWRAQPPGFTVVFLMCHIGSKIALPRTFPSSYVRSGNTTRCSPDIFNQKAVGQGRDYGSFVYICSYGEDLYCYRCNCNNFFCISAR